MESLKSPDAALIVDWYELSDGGAASAAGDVVSIRLATDPFRVTSDCVFAAADAHVINLKWISNRELEIDYPSRASISIKSGNWRDVTIRFVAHQYDGPAR
jgi:hypothetical protein